MISDSKGGGSSEEKKIGIRRYSYSRSLKTRVRSREMDIRSRGLIAAILGWRIGDAKGGNSANKRSEAKVGFSLEATDNSQVRMANVEGKRVEKMVLSMLRKYHRPYRSQSCEDRRPETIRVTRRSWVMLVAGFFFSLCCCDYYYGTG